MIRISRLTDYGILLMSHIAAHPERVHNATEVASEARLPAPTVSKLLRLLTKEGLLASHRGVKGGYGLARRPIDISVGQIVAALEGPIAITTCTGSTPGDCEHESLCPVRGHWHLINLAIRQALESITLADMAGRPQHLRLPTLATLPTAPLPAPCAPAR
ncbi:MAG: SUF system Fe-S cluster assembly regulator [Candidatus Binatia bacterium]